MFRLVCHLTLLIRFVPLCADAAIAQSHEEIKLVQVKLAEYGAGRADGRSGSKTRVAIMAYQRAWQIPETGQITDDLIAMLMRVHPKTRPQWHKVKGRECEVWMTPYPQLVHTWTGGCRNGKASGNGVQKWSYLMNGKRVQEGYFEGEFRDGKRHGYGAWKDSTGARCKGEFRDGKQHGTGVCTWADGQRYEGEYKNGKIHGNGVFTWASGNRYDGTFRDGRKHGEGVFTWADGSRHEGEYRNDRQHGLGIATWASGERYEGSYRNGRPHGQGTYIRANGKREQRQWRNGCSKGSLNRAISRSLESCGF
ncbi:MAG: peptidoglycan-binding protein [Hyphomicrobiaceae bacterium]